jgi:hypothetical protein
MAHMNGMRVFFALLGASALAAVATERLAEACGCFAPPDPSVPIVQAGERILFSTKDGVVTAHIQIQYKGAAADFGWILPLPSVPTLDVGTDELFTDLISTTQPKYLLTYKYDDSCVLPKSGGGATTAGPPATPGANDASGGRNDIVVVQSSVGPYDYAVLHAEKKDDMLAWLGANHYFIPAGTDAVVGPYIHPGAYFLALKLKSGADVGDLQPVVVKYASDLPMIPIVLTSVAAQADMGIQVWMLGASRAIPRNYYHTVINDALIDWSTNGKNYNDVIIAATKEAKGRHTFVTEYAGPSSVMQGQLYSTGRFGSLAELASQPSPIAFVTYLYGHGYTVRGPTQAGPIFVRPQLSSIVTEVLGKYIPVPPALKVDAQTFYSQISYYLGAYRDAHPEDFAGYTVDYQPGMMAADLDERVVTPTRNADQLFNDYSYLTRLYTTLSPEQMDKDPVFSWNKDLPSVSNVHNAVVVVHCDLFTTNLSTAPATLTTGDGLRIEYPQGYPAKLPDGVPASRRIETLPEEGPAKIELDNFALIQDRVGGTSGCAVGGGPASGAGLAGVAALLVGLRLRRRRG